MEDRRTDDTAVDPRKDQVVPQERRTMDQQARRTEQPVPAPMGMPLIDRGSMADFERRWQAVQADFVDDPRRSVGQAGNVMADLMEHIAKSLRQRGADLGAGRAGEMDTEGMRMELQRYRQLMSRVVGDPTGEAQRPAADVSRTRPAD